MKKKKKKKTAGVIGDEDKDEVDRKSLLSFNFKCLICTLLLTIPHFISYYNSCDSFYLFLKPQKRIVE